jgi:hypothetical protein
MHDGRTGGVLMLVIALAAIATWVPACRYVRNTGVR